VGPFDRFVALTQALAESLELPEVLNRIVLAATELVPDTAVRLWVADGGSLVLRAEAGTTTAPGGFAETVLTLGEGPVGRAAATRQVVIVEDECPDPGCGNREWLRRNGFASCVALPLVVHAEVLAVLMVMTRRRHRFSTGQLPVLTSLATHAALAIHHARLFRIAEQRRRTAEALADISRVISQSLDLGAVAQRIVDSVRELFDATASVLYRWAPELNGLEAVALSGDWGPDLDGVVFPAATSAMNCAVKDRRPATTDDIPVDQRPARHRHGVATSRSILAVPLVMHDRVIGVLGIGRGVGETFALDEVRFAQAVGDQAAIAFEHAQLFEEQARLLTNLRHRRARLEAVLEVNREVSKIQPLEVLLRHVAETCGRLLNTDSVGIRLIEGEELVVAFALGAAKDVMATSRLRVGESLSGLVAATGETVLLTDPARDLRLLPRHREAMQRLGYRAFLAVPIKTAERVAGVLGIQTRRPEGFSEEDIAVVTAFAGQVGVALHNTGLYQEAQSTLQRLAETQEQLVQSQKMEALGRLAGGVAHDFNNLLTVISGQGHLLLRHLQAGELREGIDRINLAADRAAELTAQLLAFSRKQALQPRVLALNDIANELAPLLRRIIGEDIELRTILEPDLDHVQADPTQLRQVVMNLAVNARDAMPTGGRLTIETANVVLDADYARHHADVVPGPHVMLAVTDSGVGMSPETRARLFEPFYTTKDLGRGTGLGLAIVHGIVKQSGGHIWVYSEPGHGSTFKIYLPAVGGEAARPALAEPAMPALRGSETILLVEDEDDVRRLVSRVLADHGYTVLEASHPTEALETAARYVERIDLLLTDVVLPQMTGPVLANLLRDARRDVRVLFMSGYTDNAVVHHDMIAADGAYIQKPFSPDALARAVRRAFGA
jgi:signal transduction histidine kinase